MSQYQPQKIGFLDLIWHYKYQLVVYIFFISFITFAGLYFVGGVPDELKVLDTSTPTAEVAATVTDTTAQAPVQSAQVATQAPDISQGELPTKVIISKIGVNSVVTNTNSTDDTVLNGLLLKGAVRYPGSGTLGHGNMFLFGHSTGIRIVNNQAFKTFDHLKDLNIGDEIKVQSATKMYVYSVTSVSLVSSDVGTVDISSTENMITISTCDVFGQKQDRFVVQAKFVKTTSI